MRRRTFLKALMVAPLVPVADLVAERVNDWQMGAPPRGTVVSVPDNMVWVIGDNFLFSHIAAWQEITWSYPNDPASWSIAALAPEPRSQAGAYSLKLG